MESLEGSEVLMIEVVGGKRGRIEVPSKIVKKQKGLKKKECGRERKGRVVLVSCNLALARCHKSNCGTVNNYTNSLIGLRPRSSRARAWVFLTQLLLNTIVQNHIWVKSTGRVG